MTVTVSFEAPQIQANNGSTGIELSQVILPYSIRKSDDFTQCLGGQMTLGQSDGIKLTDNTKDWERIGLAKIKDMVADAEIYVQDLIIEATSEATSEAPVAEAPASEEDKSPKNVTSGDATATSVLIGGE